MTEGREMICRPRWKRTLWSCAGVGAAGAAGAAACAVGLAHRGGPWGVWAAVALFFALTGAAALYAVTARVTADAHGLRSRTLLRRWSAPWTDVVDLRVYLRHELNHRAETTGRVSVVLRDGRKRLLPLPRGLYEDADFRATLEELRGLHRRHGAPGSDHLPVLSYRTRGRPWAGALSLFVLLLAGAGVAASYVPDAGSYERAWQTAAPCTAQTPADERGDCLSRVPAVIARTDADRPKQRGWLYFDGGRPLERIGVSRDAALAFEAGDHVEVTVWHGQVMKVAGEGHVWSEHVPGAGDVAALAAALALAAGYPGAKVVLRLRGRRRPDDEVLPSALPFAGALVGSALWLVPLCYLHPADPFASGGVTAWTAGGSVGTLVLFGWAWRATRLRTPAAAREAEAAPSSSPEEEGEVFLPARFLEHTAYNPRGFGTHIVIGGGPPAVTPHSGPGRFAAKPIPVERLTVGQVRRVRGDDGGTVPGNWHIAELDDAGEPVRLAAAPADLTRILRALESEPPPAGSGPQNSRSLSSSIPRSAS
ncbi:PH domain-containing protein [Streptomyces sp. 891-h]|uniref:PH domain-containing protein n=1 Tax=Streptomyces sp. 891-h TaxID=2720714 RepID=UPI001FA9A08B|nr:PH domain-containing protein [Streptomyces sp. 891-h]